MNTLTTRAWLGYLGLLVCPMLVSAAFSSCKAKEGVQPQASASPAPDREAVATPQPPDEPEKEAAEEESTDFEIDGDANQYFGPVPLSIVFSLTEKNAKGPVKYEWDFGDGSPQATGKDQKHTYTKPGTFMAKVMATDSTGAFDHINFLFSVVSKDQWDERQRRTKAANPGAVIETTPEASPAGPTG